MTVRQTLVAGGVAGLAVPAVVLVLLGRYGVWQIMLGKTDLRAVLWPSSVMLTVGWYYTLPGVLTTVCSVAINCALYMVVALLLRAGIKALIPHRRHAGG